MPSSKRNFQGKDKFVYHQSIMLTAIPSEFWESTGYDNDETDLSSVNNILVAPAPYAGSSSAQNLHLGGNNEPNVNVKRAKHSTPSHSSSSPFAVPSTSYGSFHGHVPYHPSSSPLTVPFTRNGPFQGHVPYHSPSSSLAVPFTRNGLSQGHVPYQSSSSLPAVPLTSYRPCQEHVPYHHDNISGERVQDINVGDNQLWHDVLHPSNNVQPHGSAATTGAPLVGQNTPQMDTNINSRHPVGDRSKHDTPNGQGIFPNASNVIIHEAHMVDQSGQQIVVVNEIGPITDKEDKKAIRRLLSSCIQGVAHDSSERDPPPKCHPGTRLDICEEAKAWFRDHSRQEKIFWLHGPAGVGKSAIMQTLTEVEAKLSTSVFAAAVFLSKLRERNQTKSLFNTVAYQLAIQLPLYRDYITRILTHDQQIVEKAMKDQFDLFIARPFGEEGLLKEQFGRVLIVLDGLDEADSIDAQCELVSMIGSFAADHPSSPLIWAIASRPEPNIIMSFDDLRQSSLSYLEIKVPIDADQARADMEVFLRAQFDKIQKRFHTRNPWPSEEDFLRIAKMASGHFVYGEVATRFIGDEDVAKPVAQLKLVIATIKEAPSTTPYAPDSNPLANLDLLYSRILSTIPQKTRNTTARLLALSFVGWRLVNFNQFWLISNWLQLTSEAAYAALRKLHSILNIPAPEKVGKNTYFIPFHKSFSDYILSPTRSGAFHVSSPRKLALSGAIRVLDESRNSATSDIQVSRIKLFWAYEDKRGVDYALHLYFEWSYKAVVWNIQAALTCCDDAPRRLQDFFQAADFADFSYLSSYTLAGEPLRPYYDKVFPVLEGWGLARPITIQSIQMDCVRTTNPVDAWSFRSSKQRSDVPSLFTEARKNPWGEPPPPLAQFPDWEECLRTHLKSIEELRYPARVYLLGQGNKSAVGIYDAEVDDPDWYYIIPYNQS